MTPERWGIRRISPEGRVEWFCIGQPDWRDDPARACEWPSWESAWDFLAALPPGDDRDRTVTRLPPKQKKAA